MLQRINQNDRPQPTQFAEASLVSAGANLLITSGQVGTDRNGVVAEDIDTQTAVAWQNVLGLLSAAGTDLAHVIQATAYLTNASDIAAYRKARMGMVPQLKAPSTLVVVSALADPRYLVEIQVSAVIPSA